MGGSASACVTAVFFIVLARFPAFLQRVKREGATGPVILRLVKFHELNVCPHVLICDYLIALLKPSYFQTLRVIFRLLMTVPLVILGVDGIRGHHSINTSLSVCTSLCFSPFLLFLLFFVTGCGLVGIIPDVCYDNLITLHPQTSLPSLRQ